jgi:hypothetical protein
LSRALQSPLRATATSRAAATRARTSALDGPLAPSVSCAARTGGSGTSRSMRSSSGPEMRPR